MTLKINDTIFVKEENGMFTPPMKIVAQHSNYHNIFFTQSIDDTYHAIDTETDYYVHVSSVVNLICELLIKSDKLLPTVTETVVRPLVLSGLIDLNVLYPYEDYVKDERVDREQD